MVHVEARGELRAEAREELDRQAPSSSPQLWVALRAM